MVFPSRQSSPLRIGIYRASPLSVTMADPSHPTPAMDSPRPSPPPTLARRLAAFCLGLFGWRVIGGDLLLERAVIVVYPHTSNWDFVIGILAKIALGLRARFIGKDTLFRGPLGILMRRLGGIPVDRAHPAGVVDQMAALFADGQPLNLAIAPEGTRSWRPGWKSGFHRIALAAGVPVTVASIDYAHREAGVLANVDLCGDPEADMARIAALFEGRRGRRPALAAPLVLLGSERKGP